jgi:hypothetical protein
MPARTEIDIPCNIKVLSRIANICPGGAVTKGNNFEKNRRGKCVEITQLGGFLRSKGEKMTSSIYASIKTLLSKLGNWGKCQVRALRPPAGEQGGGSGVGDGFRKRVKRDGGFKKVGLLQPSVFFGTESSYTRYGKGRANFDPALAL